MCYELKHLHFNLIQWKLTQNVQSTDLMSSKIKLILDSLDLCLQFQFTWWIALLLNKRRNSSDVLKTKLKQVVNNNCSYYFKYHELMFCTRLNFCWTGWFMYHKCSLNGLLLCFVHYCSLSDYTIQWKNFFRCGFHIFKLISDESKIYLTRERGTFDIIGWTKNSSVIQYTHNPQTKVSSTVLGGIWINLQRHSAFHVNVIQFFNASLQSFEGIQRNLFSPPRKSINFFAFGNE